MGLSLLWVLPMLLPGGPEVCFSPAWCHQSMLELCCQCACFSPLLLWCWPGACLCPMVTGLPMGPVPLIICAQATGCWAVLAPGWSCFLNHFLSGSSLWWPPREALWPKWSQGILVSVDVHSRETAGKLGLPWVGRGLHGARQKHWLWCNSWCSCGRGTCHFAL